jgi:hypothetical protein
LSALKTKSITAIARRAKLDIGPVVICHLCHPRARGDLLY